jgi:hypothetical protein
LFAAIVESFEPEPKLLARFNSSIANLQDAAIKQSNDGTLRNMESLKKRFNFPDTIEIFDIDGKVSKRMQLESLKPLKIRESD